MKNGRTIVITAAGGGHTGRALALGTILKRKEPSIEIYFVISRNDIWSRSKIKGLGKMIEISKVRTVNENVLRAIAKFPRSFIEAVNYMPKDICIFVSMGASISVPAAFAAKLLGAKIYNVETLVRFTKPSLTAKVLSPISNEIVLHWGEQINIHPKGIVYGPIYSEPRYEPRDDGYIFVTVGTHGYPELLLAISKLNSDNVVVQTGPFQTSYLKAKHKNWIVFDFDPNFDRWLARAHIVISHFGDTAVEAALTYRKPVIIVYNPAWKTAAGLQDAVFLAKNLNAILFKKPPEKEKLERALREAENLQPPYYLNGAKKLADNILSYCY